MTPTENYRAIHFYYQLLRQGQYDNANVFLRIMTEWGARIPRFEIYFTIPNSKLESNISIPTIQLPANNSSAPAA